MQVTFDPTVPAEVHLVRRLLRPLDGGPGGGPGGPNRGPGGGPGGGPNGGGKPGGGGPLATDPPAVRRGLNQVLTLACGEFLTLAAAHFRPEEEFTVPALAEASGVPAETLLSRNRTLGHSCQTRGLRKRDYLTGHGGAPRRFSLPQWVHKAVSDRAAQQAGQAGEQTKSGQAA